MFDPRLLYISNKLCCFWKVMTQNPKLKKIFLDPPMVCYKKLKNLHKSTLSEISPLFKILSIYINISGYQYYKNASFSRSQRSLKVMKFKATSLFKTFNLS